MVAPDRTLDYGIPYDAVLEIAKSEGCRLKAYLCPAGVWTIGWGETAGVRAHDVWTQEEADSALAHSLKMLSQTVIREAGQCTESQLGAMVSLVYNIGLTGFRRSTVLKAHKRGDYQAAARAFLLWNKATVDGKLCVLPGLTARRHREAALYLREVYAEEMPQSVEPESSLSKSPIANGGVAAIGSGLLTAASGYSETIAKIASSLTVSPLIVGGVAITIVGAIVIYYRWKQRQEGWA